MNVFLRLACVLLAADLAAGVWGTWDGIELDKYASVWLIARHIDREARFVVVPSGESVGAATPFDVPEARFKRSGGKTTLDLLAETYGVNDPAVEALRGLVREIEISRWAREPSPEAAALEARLADLLQGENDPPKRVEKALAFFDAWAEAKERGTVAGSS